MNIKELRLNKKLILVAGAAIVIIILIALLFSRKGKNDYSGCYVKVDGNEFYVVYIDKGEFTCVTNRSSQGYLHTGTVEKGDGCGYVYLINDSNWGKFSPLVITKSDDGKKLYVDSKGENWSMDIYDVVNKKDYEKILEEIAGDKGMDSWEDWLDSLLK